MIEHINQTFSSLFDHGMSLSISNKHFIHCNFEWCGLSLTKEIEKRSRVNNVELIDCRANGCQIGPTILEDICIDGLATNDLLILWGTVFSRVTLKGRIGKIKLNTAIDAIDVSPARQANFDQHREEWYQKADWALDISQARFKLFEVCGIPSRLVRRDPETQIVVTRELALQKGWREKLSKSNTLYPFMIDLFLSDGDEDRVLVAPLDAPKKKRDVCLFHINELRDVGVALPD